MAQSSITYPDPFTYPDNRPPPRHRLSLPGLFLSLGSVYLGTDNDRIIRIQLTWEARDPETKHNAAPALNGDMTHPPIAVKIPIVLKPCESYKLRYACCAPEFL